MKSQLNTVADAMTKKLVTVSELDLLANIQEAMHRLRVRHMPVVDGNGRLIGLVSQPDLLHAASSFLSDREAERNELIDQVPVGRVMQREVITARADDLLIDAGRLMWEMKIGCLPVVDADGRLIGIITEADFIAIAVQLLGSEIVRSDVEELARSRRAG